MSKTIQDVFKAERQAWLDSARATARGLLLDTPLITIEDVLKECPRPLMNGRHVRLWRLADAD